MTDISESQLSLILPTLNERENIVPQIRQIFLALPSIGEIIVVDDSSSDGTIDAVRSHFAEEVKRGLIRILERKENFGLSPSLKEGIASCRNPYVGWMDCDLSMPASLLRSMLERVTQGDDVCIGTRFGRGGEQKRWREVGKDSRLEIVLSNFLNRSLRWLLRLPISDYTSGFVIAKKSLLDQIQWRGHHGEYFIDFMVQAHRKGARMSEFPYHCENRKFGKTKTLGSPKACLINSFRYFVSVVKILTRTVFQG